jgi:flagella basal body P-ring formation protein FlgA
MRGLLSDAGVNLATVRLRGATRCTVARTDVQFNEGDALQKWLDARDPKKAAAKPAPVAAPMDSPPTVAVARTVAIAPAPADAKTTPEPVHSLRSLLIADLATRLSLPADTLQVGFDPKDDRVLNLVEGVFEFSLVPVRARDLGHVQYDVTITNNGNSQKVPILAQAQAWQQQVVVMRPVSFKQIIREQDLKVRKALVDRLSTDPLITLNQAVGQQAARDLKPGMVLTGRLVDAVPLVHTGQLVTVTFTQGTVQLRSVARAMEGGTFGQPIQVKNETTGAIFEVVLNGPQTATMSAAKPSEPASISYAR